MLVEDTPGAQYRMTNELTPEKPNRNLTKSEMAQLERETDDCFLTRGIDTLDCVV